LNEKYKPQMEEFEKLLEEEITDIKFHQISHTDLPDGLLPWIVNAIMPMIKEE
jgi:hypothetical protein